MGRIPKRIHELTKNTLGIARIRTELLKGNAPDDPGDPFQSYNINNDAINICTKYLLRLLEPLWLPSAAGVEASRCALFPTLAHRASFRCHPSSQGIMENTLDNGRSRERPQRSVEKPDGNCSAEKNNGKVGENHQ